MQEDLPPVLILAPLAGDPAALTREVEAAGYHGRVLDDPEALAATIARDGAESALCIIISQEGACAALGEALGNVFRSEPDWAQLPVLFLINSVKRPPPAVTMLNDLNGRTHFMQLQRPVHPLLLKQVIQTFAASRERQFRTRDLMERLRKEEERSAFLLGELRHRVRNSLTILHSLFKMSARRSDTVADLAESFGDRLRNLTDAYLEAAGDCDVPLLSELVRKHVGPYAVSQDQIEISNDRVRLSETAAFDFALVVHELATNAAKYGALSTPAGRVEVSWRVHSKSSNLDLIWRERGGPPAEQPSRRGLGTTLISNFPRAGGARAAVSFDEEGLIWRAGIPAGDYSLVDGKEA